MFIYKLQDLTFSGGQTITIGDINVVIIVGCKQFRQKPNIYEICVGIAKY